MNSRCQKDLAVASTEQTHSASASLDRRSISSLVSLFIDEERCVEKALRDQRKNLALACDLIFQKMSAGGRLFYVGAGTSGRLGVLDASEIPPTFGMKPELVQGIIAGGAKAVFRSQEGVEDQSTEGARALRSVSLRASDVVCGIAASGRTPFVLGALKEAKRHGAGTIFLTCNPRRPRSITVDVAIDLPTGPEIIAGSTRLKAGSATKCALNLMSSIVMIRLGKVRQGRMVSLQTSNEKLKLRAIQTVVDLGKVKRLEARKCLMKSGWSVNLALRSIAGSGKSR